MESHPRITWSRCLMLSLAAVGWAALAGCSGSVTTEGGANDPCTQPGSHCDIDASDPGGGGGDADAGDPGGGDVDAGAPGGGGDVDAGHGGGGPVDAGNTGGGDLTYREANLTNFTSYPDPNSDECLHFNGCLWEGQFAFVNGKQTENWVMMHNIIAVHSKDANAYKLKTLRLRQGSHHIDAVVYDMCSDSDCSGCCTQNSSETGFLIDIESYTMDRFGSGDGIVEWACVDCN